MAEMKSDWQAKKQLIAILIMTPIMLILFKLILPKLTSSPMMRDAFWANKVLAEPIYDAVFIGDSRVYRGLDPDVIQKQSGLKCFNYGFSGAGLSGEFIDSAILKLKGNGRKVCVIGVTANSFMNISLKNEHLHSVLNWSKSDLLIKAKLYSKLNFFDPIHLSDVFNAIRKQAYIENYHIHNGFAASDKIPFDEFAAIDNYKKLFEQEKLKKEELYSFKAKIKDLSNQGYIVVILRVPFGKALVELEDKMSNDFVVKLLYDLGKEGYYVFKPSTYNWRSYDGSHLSSESAKQLSLELGNYLNALK
ncbi:MAG TPA: hypothetical protein VGF79_14490 [Bacteroidia bacterium]